MFNVLKYVTKQLPTIGMMKSVTLIHVMTFEDGAKNVRAGAFDSAKIAEFGVDGIANWTAEHGERMDQLDAERIFPELRTRTQDLPALHPDDNEVQILGDAVREWLTVQRRALESYNSSQSIRPGNPEDFNIPQGEDLLKQIERL